MTVEILFTNPLDKLEISKEYDSSTSAHGSFSMGPAPLSQSMPTIHLFNPIHEDTVGVIGALNACQTPNINSGFSSHK